MSILFFILICATVCSLIVIAISLYFIAKKYCKEDYNSMEDE